MTDKKMDGQHLPLLGLSLQAKIALTAGVSVSEVIEANKAYRSIFFAFESILEELQTEAYGQGHSDGYAEGYDAGFEEFD